MKLSITGMRSELGRVVARRAPAAEGERVHISLAGQHANTLLHDGHEWKNFAAPTVRATRRAIRAARTGDAVFLVHASFAFVHAVDCGGELEDPLRACVEAIRECEALVLAGPVPACVVRLGYLYGPESADLRAYRKAFGLGRPYWSGPSEPLQYHVHQYDAADALVAAARARRAGKVYYATDGRPLPFRTLMDAFAHRVGRVHPLHLPAIAKTLARVIIREEHMQQTAFGMPIRVPTPRVPKWKPRFSDYRTGLDQVVAAWRD